VRVIEYTVHTTSPDGTEDSSEVFALVTDLLDIEAPAALDMACAYPMRWECETVIRHLKTNMGPGMPVSPACPLVPAPNVSSVQPGALFTTPEAGHVFAGQRPCPMIIRWVVNKPPEVLREGTQSRHRSKFVGSVFMRERILRYRETECGANRIPPITRCPLDETPSRNPKAYSLIMTFVRLAGRTLVAEVLTEPSSEHGTGHPSLSSDDGLSWLLFRDRRLETLDQLEDCMASAAPPRRCRSDGEHDDRVWIGVNQV